MAMFDLKKLYKYEEKGKLRSSIHPYHNLSIWNYREIVHYQDEWDDITLNCRATIIKNDTGEIVARAFPKFFNYEENKHTPTDSFRIFNKADGSLGILFFYKESSTDSGQWIFASRGSFISEQAIKGKEILDELYPQYVDLDKNLSYVFEIIYPENRIVVNYGSDRKLIYLSSFETNGVEHLLLNEMKEKGFDIIEEYEFADKTIDDMKSMNIPNSEGFVIRFDSGERIKIKFEDYLKLHKTATKLSNKTIFEMCCTGKSLDELLEDIPDEFNDWFKDIYNATQSKYDEIKEICRKYLDEHIEEPRKDFFIGIVNHPYKNILGALYVGDEDKSKSLIYKAIDVKSFDIKDRGFTAIKEKPKKKSIMIFLIGRSGSGKSTWTNRFMRDRKDCIRVNRDTIRISIFGLLDERDIVNYYKSPELKQKEKMVTEMSNFIIKTGIRDGMTIIIDNTNLDYECIKEDLKLADETTLIQYKVFGEELTDEELFERTKERNQIIVSLNIIKKQTIKFKALLPKLPELFNSKSVKTTITQNPELSRAVIFDIDGTLALNLGGRSPYDMSRLMEDSPNQHIIDLAKLLKTNGKTIILCSGREDNGREQTVEWMKLHGVEFDELHMRKKGDHRKDFIIKEELWRDICSRYYIENMFDDRNQVVEHARTLGFNVCQVADGNF